MAAQRAHVSLVPPPAPTPPVRLLELVDFIEPIANDFARGEPVVPRRGRAALQALAAVGLVALGAAAHAFMSPAAPPPASAGSERVLEGAAAPVVAAPSAQPIAAAAAPAAPSILADAPKEAAVLVRSASEAVEPAAPITALPEVTPAPPSPVVRRAQVGLLLRRGAKLVEGERYRAALPVFQAAAKQAPLDPDAWYGLALVRAELGDLTLSRRAARMAVKVAPDHPQALVLLGFLEQLFRKVGDSKALYQRYLDTNPGGPWAAELSAVLSTIDQPLPTARQKTRR